MQLVKKEALCLMSALLVLLVTQDLNNCEKKVEMEKKIFANTQPAEPSYNSMKNEQQRFQFALK